MSRKEYLATGAPLGVLVLLCLLQVYVYRLRRVVAAFYFPKVGELPPKCSLPSPLPPETGHGRGLYALAVGCGTGRVSPFPLPA